MGKFDTLKSYISSTEGKNKELTEKAAASSREVKILRNEVKSLGSSQEKSSEDITRLTFEKDRAEKKATELTTALELKKIEHEEEISGLRSVVARLEGERERTV